MKKDETISFRTSPRNAWWVAGLSAALLFLLIAALVLGPTNATLAQRLGGILGLVFLSCLSGVFVYVALRPPVTLRVGPNGIDLPVALRAPLPWRDIGTVTRETAPPGIYGRRDWLIVHPVAGVLPDHRLSGPRRLELWYMRRVGIRIPLHGLAAPADEVIAAVARYFPGVA